MALAPSEKHLEDWIVANPLAFGEVLESGLVPDEYLPDKRFEFENGDWIERFFGRLVARQKRLPSGICDLLYASPYSLDVVELKRESITFDVVGQCLRYMHDIREILYWAKANAHIGYPIPNTYEMTEYPESEINGMIIGSSVKDENILNACYACNIAVVIYDFNEDFYEFSREAIPLDFDGIQVYKDYAYGVIGQELQKIMKNHADRAERQRK